MDVNPVRLHGSLKEYAGEEFQVSAKKVHIETMNLINADMMSSIPGMENVPRMPPAKPLVDNNVTGPAVPGESSHVFCHIHGRAEGF